jgi:DNA primase
MQTGTMTSNKPSIVEVIGQRLALRRSGSDFVGLCPFHDDRYPSFHVSERYGRYHCFGCDARGDVIDFVMRIDGLNFSETCRELHIRYERRRRPKLTAGRIRAAELAASWVREQRTKLNCLLVELMEERDLADEIGDFALFEIFEREIILLRALHDSLKYPRSAAELLGVRQTIEQITAEVEMIYEPPLPFPPLTPDYIARLKQCPLDFEGCIR